jgi:phospholipid:diacylglycerol acyltransferase
MAKKNKKSKSKRDGHAGRSSTEGMENGAAAVENTLGVDINEEDTAATEESTEKNGTGENSIKKKKKKKSRSIIEDNNKGGDGGDAEEEFPHPASTKPGGDENPQRVKKRTLFFYVAALFLVAYGPKLMVHTGITDQDYMQDFIDTSVRPHMDEAMKMFNETFTGDDNPYFSDKNRTGLTMAQKGARAKHPIAIVPGFVTTGLEFWEGELCAKKYFRQRVWGGMNMANAFFSDRECWRKHLSLDPHTGIDPEGIKIRGAQGYEAADYFMGTYWVFAKLIENLADVGYDPNNMVMFPYDWRLAYPLLQKRDGYLSKLKVNIEWLKESLDEKVVIMSHSMGSEVVLFFWKWVETPKEEGGGGGGDDWVDTHIHAFANIAGTLLGVPKAYPALMSGEMKDTALIAGPMNDLMERFFGRKSRKDMFNSWGSLWAMLPKGGNAIWGVGADIAKPSPNATSNMTDHDESITEIINEMAHDDDVALTPMMTITGYDTMVFDDETDELADIEQTDPDIVDIIRELAKSPHVSLEDGIKFLKKWGGGHGSRSMSSKLHSFGKPMQKNATGVEYWHDPTVTPLPKAPDMKIYCLYGVGRQTERAYYYKPDLIPASELPKEEEDESGNGDNCPASEDGDETCVSNKNSTTKRTKNQPFADPPFVLDTSRSKDDGSESRGVVITDGDGSVPVLSSGYMCVSGWVDNEHLNPAGIKPIVREYANKEFFQVNDPMRGGPYSSEHCDVLGNHDTTEDIIKIVTGFEDETLENKIASDIIEIAKKIDNHKMGGIRGKR